MLRWKQTSKRAKNALGIGYPPTRFHVRSAFMACFGGCIAQLQRMLDEVRLPDNGG